MMDNRTTSDTIQGPVAQMVEQRPCKSQAAGSIPGQGLQRKQFQFTEWNVKLAFADRYSKVTIT